MGIRLFLRQVGAHPCSKEQGVPKYLSEMSTEQQPLVAALPSTSQEHTLFSANPRPDEEKPNTRSHALLPPNHGYLMILWMHCACKELNVGVERKRAGRRSFPCSSVLGWALSSLSDSGRWPSR